MDKVNVGNTRGIMRKIDEAARVTIPSEFRKELNIKENEWLEMFLMKDGVYLRKKKFLYEEKNNEQSFEKN